MAVSFHTTKEAGEYMKEIIDSYWAGDLKATRAKKMIESALDAPANRLKIKRGDKYTAVFQSIMGKRRIIDFELLLGNND